jgi:hypothetical protein
MDAAGRTGVTFDHMAACEGIVEPRPEAAALGYRNRFVAQPFICRPAAAVAEHDRRNACGRRGHRMAVEQKRAAESLEECIEFPLDCAMVGSMDLLNPFLQLRLSDRASPEIAVLLRTGGYNSQAAARPSGNSAAARSVDHRWIDLVLGPVAIHRCSRRTCDDRGAATLLRSPDEAIDEWIFECLE